MGYIDAHVHVWTQDVASYPVLDQYKPEDMKPLTFLPEELLGHCQPLGVDRVVLIQMSYYGTDNSYMLDTIARFPEVFRGVAIIDHAAADAPETMASLRPKGVRGLRVQPGGMGIDEWLGGDDYERVLGAAGEMGIAICPLIGPEFIPSVARAAENFAGTTFVVDHLCRIGAGSPIEQTQIDQLCGLATFPNCHVKVSAFYALGEKTAPYLDLIPMIRQVCEAYGPERLMWATDCPYEVERGSYSASLALVRDHLDFLSDADRDQMLRGTAERIFFGD